jgi:hypothetical protein
MGMFIRGVSLKVNAKEEVPLNLPVETQLAENGMMAHWLKQDPTN